MSSTQIAVRLPTDLLEAIDDLVKSGLGGSRADLVRQALERFIDEAERVGIDRAIADGYRRTPPTPEEDAAAMHALRQSIAEEPW